MSGPLSIASPPTTTSDRPLPAAEMHGPRDRGAVRRAAATTASAATTSAPPTMDPEQQEVAHLKSLLTDPSMRVSTHHDGASDRVVLRVQRETGELVEQIPSERLLRLYAAMRQSLVDEQV